LIVITNVIGDGDLSISSALIALKTTKKIPIAIILALIYIDCGGPP
jgi:hypothetical protein